MTHSKVEEVEDVQGVAGSTWWIYLLQGIVAVVLGFLLLASTAKTLKVLIAIMGIYWIISGIFNIVAALTGHVQAHKWWVVVAGVISIIAGMLVLDNMVWSTVVVPTLATFIIGIAAVVNGLVTIVAGRSKGEARQRSWGGFFLGLLYIGIGVLVMLNPLLSAVALVYATAVWALIGGLVLIVMSFQVKKLKPA